MSDTDNLTPAKSSSAAIVFGAILCGVIGLLWVPMNATLTSLTGSDAAGNGIAQAYAGISIALVWGVLGLLVMIAVFKGRMPIPERVAVLVLVPASGVAAFEVLALLSRPYGPPYQWPIVITLTVPPLLALFCLWALVPVFHARMPAWLAGSFTLGLALIVCLAIIPMDWMRQRDDAREQARLEKYDADYAALPADARLPALAPFLETRNSTIESALIDRIRALNTRQADAEAMLERGDFPLGYLGRLDLDPTVALCDKARAMLRRRVAPLVSQQSGTRPFTDVSYEVQNALAAMKWMVGYNCAVNAESQAWEDMANGYRDTNFDVVELRELRDPKNLGRLLREYPERFSMLTSEAHLRAWLSFADQKEFHDAAIDGARKLDHRTADAIAMMNGNEYSAMPVLKYFPQLDLEATPVLCSAASRAIGVDFARVYRPKPEDEPRPYSELLERLGGTEPLTVLVWLGEHGCAPEAQLRDAEAMIGTYRDSPGKARMLAKLAGFRRAP